MRGVWLRWASLVAVVGIGLALRLAILEAPVGRIDPDDAAIGLMGREFLDGHVRAFFWGQDYGGTLEPLLTAGTIAVLGPTRLAIKVVPIALHGVSAVLLWRLGRRVIDSRTGGLAAASWWVGPGAYLWWSTKAKGYYGALLVVAILATLLAVRYDDRPSRRDAGALGLVLGLALWTSPQSVVVAGPACAWLVARRFRSLTRDAPVVLIAGVIGAIPWWWANLSSGFGSLDVPGGFVGTTFGDRWRLWWKGLPFTTGLRGPYEPATVAMVVISVVLIGIGLIALWRWRRAWWLVMAVIIPYPFLFALNELAPSNELDGRYQYVLAPFVALSLAAVVTRVLPTRAWIVGATGLVLVATGASALITAELRAEREPEIADFRIFLVAPDIRPLVDSFDGLDTRVAWADRPMHELVWASDEQVIAASFPAERYDRYLDIVRNSSQVPAYVLVDGGGNVEALTARLEQLGVDFEVRCAGAWMVVAPERRVDPIEADVRIPFPSAVPRRCR